MRSPRCSSVFGSGPGLQDCGSPAQFRVEMRADRADRRHPQGRADIQFATAVITRAASRRHPFTIPSRRAATSTSSWRGRPHSADRGPQKIDSWAGTSRFDVGHPISTDRRGVGGAVTCTPASTCRSNSSAILLLSCKGLLHAGPSFRRRLTLSYRAWGLGPRAGPPLPTRRAGRRGYRARRAARGRPRRCETVDRGDVQTDRSVASPVRAACGSPAQADRRPGPSTGRSHLPYVALQITRHLRGPEPSAIRTQSPRPGVTE